MKTLLCLLSDQHVPNLLSTHHYKPDRLVLLASREMQAKGAPGHFQNALKLGGMNFEGDRCVVEPLEKEDDLDSIRRCLQRAYGKYPTDDWVANVSGGTKPMSIATYEFFKALGSRIVYVNVRRPDEVLDLDGGTPEKCAYRPSIREFLGGYGFGSSKKVEDIAADEERARSWWNCARLIAQDAPAKLLLQLGDLSDPAVKRRWDDARKRGITLERGGLVLATPELCAEAARAFGLSDSAAGLAGRLDKYAVGFFTGGWLEVFIWGLIDRHAASMGIWDVRLGIKPAKDGANVDSDFDVAFMHAHRLCMVECKSGSQAHDSGADVLHKVEAVVRQFRALGVRSYLVTTSGNVLDKEGAIRPSVRDRASIYQCSIITRDRLRELAISADNADLVRSVFLGTQTA